MTISRSLFIVFCILIPVQFLAALGSGVALDNTDQLKLVDKEQVSVTEILEFTENLTNRGNREAREVLQKEFSDRISAFFNEPNLVPRLLRLQEIIGKGGGPYWVEAQGVLYYICAHSDASLLLKELVPYLRSGKLTERQRRDIEEILTWASGSEKGPRFERWLPYIEEHADDPPVELVEWMYRAWADPAFETLVHVYSKRKGLEGGELLDAADTLKEWKRIKYGLQAKTAPEDERMARQKSVEKLNELVKHKEWWIQLYVAEKMRRNVELRSSVLVGTLKNSSHHLVRKTVKEIEGATPFEVP
jgi:hypothetical protein